MARVNFKTVGRDQDIALEYPDAIQGHSDRRASRRLRRNVDEGTLPRNPVAAARSHQRGGVEGTKSLILMSGRRVALEGRHGPQYRHRFDRYTRDAGQRVGHLIPVAGKAVGGELFADRRVIRGLFLVLVKDPIRA